MLLGGLFSWLSLLFEPLADTNVPPIQPQARLRPENRPWQNIIHGVYGYPPEIKIHDRTGEVSWSFRREDVNQDLPPAIKKCLWGHSNDATEIKYMHDGKSVGAIYADLAMVVNHLPDDPVNDKKITWAICRDNDVLWNAHTLEALPNGLFAIGTTGQRPWDGILVYNASLDNPLVDEPPIVQNITGLRAIHALIWDEQEQILWGAGTDAAADGSDPVPAYGLVQGYPFDAATGKLSVDERYIYKLPNAYGQQVEWGQGYSWWAGFHDMVPVPNERKFLLSEDRGLHALDLETGEYFAEDAGVVEKYMKGFEVTTDDRHGYNGANEYEDLPYSDLKSFNLAPDGSFIYVQSLWTKFRGFYINLVVDGHRRKINLGDEIYRARWWGDMDGWPKPK